MIILVKASKNLSASFQNYDFLLVIVWMKKKLENYFQFLIFKSFF